MTENPQHQQEQDLAPEQKQNLHIELSRKEVLAHGALGAGLLLLGAYGLGRLAYDVGDSEWLNSSTQQGPQYFEYEREHSLNGLVQGFEEEHIENLSSSDIQNLLLNVYEEQRTSLSSVIGYQIRTNYDDETKQFIEEKRQELVLDGIGMVSKYFGESEINVDTENGVVVIPDTQRSINVNDPYDAILLDQFTLHKMKAIVASEGEEKIKAEENVAHVLWLINNQNLDVEISDNSAFIFEDDSLLTVSKLSQFLEKNNITEFPPITIEPYLGEGTNGYYVFASAGEKHEMKSINKDAGAVLAHEFGHFVSDVSEVHSQENFNEYVATRKAEVAQEGFAYAGQVSFVSKYAETSIIEDFAETFEEYFIRGKAFRNNLKNLAIESPADYEILHAKYEFMRDFFGGVEFIDNGEEFLPEKGQSYTIEDPDPDSDVSLWAEPHNRNEVTGGVNTGNFVTIIDGPTESHYEIFDRTHDFYKVASQQPTGETVEGWISEIWFGDKKLVEGPGK